MSLKQEFRTLIYSSSSLYIYGCGKIGKTVFSLIEFFGLKSKIKAFLVTDARQAGGVYLDVPVICIKDFSDAKGLILISLAEIYHAEVEEKLRSLNIGNYVNAYKYIFVDVEREDCVEHACVGDLLKFFFKKNDYGHLDIVIRLLAIENLYGKNNYGIRMYKVLMDSFWGDANCRTNAKPSEIYLSRFIALANSIEKNGFFQDSEIVILRKTYRVLNGKHRLALSLFYSLDSINVRYIFSYPYQPKVILNSEWYKKHFSEDDMKFILNRLNQLKEKYGI